MKKQMLFLITTAAVFLLPAWSLAASCNQLPTFNKELSINDQKKSIDVVACNCSNMNMLAINATVQSSLVKANTFITVSFRNNRGTTLSAWNSKPLVGKFNDFEFNHHIEIPEGAHHATVSISVDSNYEYTTGSVQYHFTEFGKGLAIDLKPDKLPVMTENDSHKWKIISSSIPENASAELTVYDFDHQQVHQENIKKIQSGEHTLQIPKLPAGHYKLSFKAKAPGHTHLTINKSAAIVKEIPDSKDPRFGIDGALSWYGGSLIDIEYVLDILDLSGVGSIRDRLSWAHTQPTPHLLYWKRYKEVSRKVQDHGYEQVTTFHNSPHWTRLNDSIVSSDRRPPQNLDAVERYGSIFARDMGKYIQAIEFWNEPDTSFFPDYPWQYANLIKSFSAGLRAENPEMKLLIGSAAGDPGIFYEQVYDNGVNGYFDLRNQHYHGMIDNYSSFFRNKVRPVEYKQKIHLKPGWITETGVSLRRDDFGSYENSEREQADFLVKALSLALATGYEKAFFFILRELQESNYHNWGMLNYDFSPRPAYSALAALIQVIDQKPILASQIGKQSSIIYFGKKSGSISAIAWGEGSLQSDIPSHGQIYDVIGRPITSSDSLQLSNSPLLISGITKLPDSAFIIRPPISTSTPIPPFRLQVNVEKPKISHPTNEKLGIKVTDNTEIQLELSLTANKKLDPTNIELQCSGSRGITSMDPDFHQLTLTSDKPKQTKYCRFKTDISRYGDGYVSAEATSANHSESIKIVLKADMSDSIQTAVPVTPSPTQACLKVVKRHSANVNLALKSIANETAPCEKTKILSNIIEDGETWVFPAWVLDETPLKGDGIQIGIETIPNVKHPPRPIMAQIIELDGTTWLLQLQSEVISSEHTRHTGLYSAVKLASWSKNKKDQLDKSNVAEILLGWGGYGGQKGQSFGFTVESLSFIQF